MLHYGLDFQVFEALCLLKCRHVPHHEPLKIQNYFVKSAEMNYLIREKLQSNATMIVFLDIDPIEAIRRF
jgi:hypothetical protein